MDSPTHSQQQQSEERTLCSAQCGFFGSSETNGLCSVCYKARQSQGMVASSAATAPSLPAALPAEAEAAAPEPQVEAEAAEAAAQQSAVTEQGVPAPTALVVVAAELPQEERPVQENRGRCFCCRKKVGLLGFECRCGYVFCGGHRHARDHACSFDYATFDKANLAKTNTKVVAAKLDKL